MKRELTDILHRSGIILLSVVLLLIAVFSLAPSASVSKITPHMSDKIQHYLAYCALGFSAFIAFFVVPDDDSSFLKINIRMMVTTLIFGFIFGILIEFIQPFFSRSAELMDALSDLAGILTGEVVAFLICLCALKLSRR